MSVSGQFTPGQFTLGNTMPMTVDLVIKTLRVNCHLRIFDIFKIRKIRIFFNFYYNAKVLRLPKIIFQNDIYIRAVSRI